MWIANNESFMKTYIIMLLAFLVTRVSAQNSTDWFVFKPNTITQNNAIDMSSWLDKPAGKHGFLQMKGKDYAFEDGTPVKFWGVNIASQKPFVDSAEAKHWTKFIAGYGINAVRFHKFTWDATDGIRSTQITDANWKNFDFFCNELRQAGIYYSWSHIYGHRVMPADSSKLLAYSEIKNTKFPWSHLNSSTASLVNFAEDLQAINIELTVNMLNHINFKTGLRYADDPALNFIELQNEDNIFWSAIEETLKQTPTYRALLCKKFSLWLKEKYGTSENFLKAWNNEGLPPGETLQQQNIYPIPNHGYFTFENDKAANAAKPVPMNVTDRATFLYEEQLRFYQRFTKAIRATGYKGVIVSSCWQAGSGLSHLYNLHTDYITGPIDRHNYFGGGEGHQLKTGKFDNTAMLTHPGSGLLSTGFQQVNNRPFQVSEWMELIPTEWVAESAPIVAMYGMGLQGWDASYSFAMDYSAFTPTIQSHGVYNVTSPTQLSLYPALAAMIYRSDIKEGKPVINRNTNISDLKKGQVLVNEKVAQGFDVKSFSSDAPQQVMGVGPVTLSFDDDRAALNQGWQQYIDSSKKIVQSNTGQLLWDYAGKGFFSINTNGTQGVVGFTNNKKIQLQNIQLQTSNTFAVILATSLDKKLGLDSCKRILITTIARAKNTGMEFSADTSALTSLGIAPILLEPVNVKVKLKRNARAILHLLDHSGNRTGQKIPFKNGVLSLQGSGFKSIYYEVVFE